MSEHIAGEVCRLRRVLDVLRDADPSAVRLAEEQVDEQASCVRVAQADLRARVDRALDEVSLHHDISTGAICFIQDALDGREPDA